MTKTKHFTKIQVHKPLNRIQQTVKHKGIEDGIEVTCYDYWNIHHKLWICQLLFWCVWAFDISILFRHSPFWYFLRVQHFCDFTFHIVICVTYTIAVHIVRSTNSKWRLSIFRTDDFNFFTTWNHWSNSLLVSSKPQPWKS